MTNSSISSPPKLARRESVSRWDDLVDLIISPGRLFARRMGTDPWLLLIGVTLLASLIYFATQGALRPVRDADFNLRVASYVARHPEVTPAQVSDAQRVGDQYGALGLLILVPAGIWINAILLRLLARAFGATASRRDSLLVASCAWIPLAVSPLASVAMVLLTSPASITSSLSVSLSVGRFLDPRTTPALLFALAGRIDVFVIWQIVLLAAGMYSIWKMPRGGIVISALALWLLDGVPELWGALNR